MSKFPMRINVFLPDACRDGIQACFFLNKKDKRGIFVSQLREVLDERLDLERKLEQNSKITYHYVDNDCADY